VEVGRFKGTPEHFPLNSVISRLEDEFHFVFILLYSGTLFLKQFS